MKKIICLFVIFSFTIKLQAQVPNQVQQTPKDTTI